MAINQIRQLSQTTREGSSLLSLSDAAEQMGFKTLGVKLNLSRLQEAPLPCIVHWNKNQFDTQNGTWVCNYCCILP
jgi:ATP-binding cassette subfamily B protein